MNALDIAALFIVLVCGVGCAIRGIVKEVFGIASFFVGALAAYLFWRPLSRLIILPPDWAWASVAISCAALFVSAFLMVRLVERGFHDGLEAMRMGVLDHSLGFALGVFEGILVSLLIASLIAAQPVFDAAPLLGGSLFWKLAGPLADWRRYVDHVR